MVQQAAGGAVGGVHGAQKAPGLGEKLTNRRRPHSGEEGASMYGAEM